MDGATLEPAAPADQEDPAPGRRRFSLSPGVTLRQHAARGTVINAVFNVGLTVLGFLKGFILAALLTPDDYGIWGILLISLGTLTWLKQVGIADKYVQQDDEDQAVAFQKAFTMEVMVNVVLLVLLLVAVPIMALVYGRSELLAPGFALCALLPALVLQTPFWVLYRQLEFRRQRLLQAIDPLIAFVVTIALAVAGMGYWSLILGVLAGSWAGALVALRITPYPLRLRYDRGTFRSYVRFSAPLFASSVGGIVIAQGSVFFSEDAVGLAAVGALTLAAQISQLASRVDDVVSSTLYPVICAVRDRRDVLYETFEKSNRIALMWAMPFGLGLALFAGDLVHFVIGDKWEAAIPVLRATGIAAGISQLGFNWTSYLRALDDTRPIGVNAAIQIVAFLATVPMMYAWGLDGFAVGIILVAVVNVIVRTAYLTRLFDGFTMVRHSIRALLPSVPAVLVVLAVRAADPASRTLGIALGELALYAAATLAATWAFERTLVREAVGYLRRRSVAATTPA